MRVEFGKARKSAWPLTVAWRHQLAEAVPPGHQPSKALLRALSRIDPNLELYWHPIRTRWILYRVVRRGGVPCEDRLVKEAELTGLNGEYREPGWWLIDLLQRWDKTQGGSIDPHQADRQFLFDMDDRYSERSKLREAHSHEISEQITNDFIKYGYGQRRSLHVNRE